VIAAKTAIKNVNAPLSCVMIRAVEVPNSFVVRSKLVPSIVSTTPILSSSRLVTPITP
jgi:hypothetical protein